MAGRFSEWSKFDLTGKSALVTGGGGFLGPEHAAALARCGASVILADIDDATLKNARERVQAQVADAVVETTLLDITDEGALESYRHNLEKRNLAVDILVNNAAINPKMNQLNGLLSGTVEDYDMRLWDLEIKVGLTGTFLCCKIFGAAMARRGHGTIINIASDLAIQAPDQRVYSETGHIEDVRNFKPIGYPIVKSAMLGLNRYLATYWAHRGVRVNCLVPGSVFNHQPRHLIDNVKERIPLARWADRAEYQGAVAFLASEASSYMTGQMLVMDGGRSIW